MVETSMSRVQTWSYCPECEKLRPGKTKCSICEGDLHRFKVHLPAWRQLMAIYAFVSLIYLFLMFPAMFLLDWFVTIDSKEVFLPVWIIGSFAVVLLYMLTFVLLNQIWVNRILEVKKEQYPKKKKKSGIRPSYLDD